MTLYIAYNGLVDATTGMMAAGTAYTAGAKVAIQLAAPSGQDIRLVEWGVSSSATAPATKTLYTLAQASAATTCTTAHSATTVMPVGDSSKTCPLTFSTSTTAFGVTGITTNTTERQFGAFLGDPTEHYEKQFPLGRDYVCQAGKFCQLRINTATSYNILAYIVFDV
jgi:hypothetical protein